MNKSFSSLWAACGMLALVVAAFAGVTATQADQVDDAVAAAVGYLQTQPDDPTKTMALVAAGESVDVSYLKSFSGSTAIAYAKPIMAIAAAGENPATYAAEDLVATLKSFSDGTQLGDATLVNDDIWGILALASAGVSASDPVIQNSKTVILSNQNGDGGWAWNVGGTSDTNDTAAAIMALLEIGMSSSDAVIQKAISYLKAAQNEDGGFPYDPESPFGTDSDANSDAWVMMAFSKLGENTADVEAHLLSLQDEDGGFWWMEPPADFNNKAATADAVIALTGNWFPVAVFSGPATPEVFFRIVGSTEEVCRGLAQAVTAMDVVIHAADDCGYTYVIEDTSLGPYLSQINDDKAEGAKGWMYLVNDTSPSIGAADYALSGGDDVLWYYGEFGDDPPVMGDVSAAVDLSLEVVEDDGGGDGLPEVAFSVSPSAFDFGKVVPGDSVREDFVLKNEGKKGLDVTAQVKGDSVFAFLKIDDLAWNVFETLLPIAGQKNVEVSLSVPAEFRLFGTKEGTLIFWAQAE